MAIGRSVYVLVTVCVLLISYGESQKSTAKKKARSSTSSVSTKYVYKQLRLLERRHTNTLARLTNALDRINYLATDIMNMKEDLKKFTDDRPCPEELGADFYSAPEFSTCYSLLPSGTFLAWEDAQAACETLNSKAHLITLETEEEHHYVTTRLRNERGIASYARFWTSGHMADNTTWVWSHSGDVITHDRWIPTTPHDNAGYGCLAIHSTEAFMWGDIRCWIPSMVLCEVNL